MRDDGDAYLPLKLLASYSGLSVRTLRGHLIDSVRPLPYYRVGGRLLLRGTQFDVWIKEVSCRRTAGAGRHRDGTAEGL